MTYRLDQPDGTRYGVPVWLVDDRDLRDEVNGIQWRERRQLLALGLVWVERYPSLGCSVYAKRLPARLWIRPLRWVSDQYFMLLIWLLSHGILLDQLEYEGRRIETWRDHWAFWRTLSPNPFTWAERRVRAVEERHAQWAWRQAEWRQSQWQAEREQEIREQGRAEGRAELSAQLGALYQETFPNARPLFTEEAPS